MNNKALYALQRLDAIESQNEINSPRSFQAEILPTVGGIKQDLNGGNIG